jgi:esterase/lipase superfamily enzyme
MPVEEKTFPSSPTVETNTRQASSPSPPLIILAILTALLFTTSVSASENDQAPGDEMHADRAAKLEKTATIPFLTLRNKSTGKGTFGGRRGRPHAGTCVVSFSPIRVLEDLADSAPFYIPDEKIETIEINEFSASDLLNGLETSAKTEGGNTVVYIHGYNIDFEKGCRHSAVLQRSLGLHDRLLLFSWPADGNVLKYTWDEADLLWSVPYMADFFEDMSRRTGPGNTDIVAHSLGARGAFQALTRIAWQNHDKALFGELVLIAPDIDVDMFRHDLPLLKKIVNRITVYVSENDKALKLSREVHGYPRLGEAGTSLTTFEGVEMIDISLISLQRISGHVYHLSNRDVIDDLGLLLRTNTPADKRPRMERREQAGISYWRMMP